MDENKIIGIMGPGEGGTSSDIEVAFELGKKLAEKGFHILTGGRASGVMEGAMKGAKAAGGVTIGILPSKDGEHQSKYVDIPIKTGMGSARNNINVLTADVIVGVGIGPGTTSEIALAIKAQKPVIILNQAPKTTAFFREFDYKNLQLANSVQKACRIIDSLS